MECAPWDLGFWVRVLCCAELCCVYVVCVMSLKIGTLGVCRRGVLCWVVLEMCKIVECDVGIVGFRFLA